MLTILDGFPGDVLAVAAKGRVTADDYRDVLVPAAEARLARHGKIRMLFHLGEGFGDYAPGAILADAEFGLGHLHDLGRTALVTDAGWIADAARLFAPFVHVPFRVFPNDDYKAACDWILDGDKTG